MTDETKAPTKVATTTEAKEAPAKAATATAEKPTAPAAAPAKPEAPAEPPFNVDIFESCTARTTRKTWNIFLRYKENNFEQFRNKPLRAKLETLSPEGAEAIEAGLREAGVSELSREGNVLNFTATFEQIQTVIKHAESDLLDVVEI